MEEGYFGEMSIKNAVLFVCLGNTCRSPAAARLLMARLALEKVSPDSWLVDSAGLQAGRGQPASNRMISALERRGLDLRAHRSRPLEDVILDLYPLVLVMEPQHRLDLLARLPHLSEKVFLLAEMCGEQTGVPDPYGSDDLAYQRTVEQLEAYIERGFSRIVANSLININVNK